MTVIIVQNLSKVYKLYDSKKDRLKEAISPLKKKYHRDFYALNDISFDVKQGETVGLIGKNGSGKSTLLKMITGLITPTSGNITVNGKVSALLELGAGFNPEYTGLENIYLNGTIMGFTREEMNAKLADIVGFADIGDFIHQPVKMYSSGMAIRLAFAAAINVNPDILIIDEALSVGDAYFQAKCFKEIEKLKDEGTTIVLVTHSTDQILTHCSKAILLNDGTKLLEGEPNQVVNTYLDLLFGKNKCVLNKTQTVIETDLLDDDIGNHNYDSSDTDVYHTRPGYNKNEYIWGNGKVKIIDYAIKNEKNEEYPSVIDSNEMMQISVKAVFEDCVAAPVYGLLFKTLEGVYLYGTNSIIEKDKDYFLPRTAGDLIVFQFKLRLSFASGSYLLSFGVSEDYGRNPLHRRYDSVMVHVHNSRQITGLFDLRSGFHEFLLEE